MSFPFDLRHIFLTLHDHRGIVDIDIREFLGPEEAIAAGSTLGDIFRGWNLKQESAEEHDRLRVAWEALWSSGQGAVMETGMDGLASELSEKDVAGSIAVDDDLSALDIDPEISEVRAIPTEPATPFEAPKASARVPKRPRATFRHLTPQQLRKPEKIGLSRAAAAMEAKAARFEQLALERRAKAAREAERLAIDTQIAVEEKERARREELGHSDIGKLEQLRAMKMAMEAVEAEGITERTYKGDMRVQTLCRELKEEMVERRRAEIAAIREAEEKELAETENVFDSDGALFVSIMEIESTLPHRAAPTSALPAFPPSPLFPPSPPLLHPPRSTIWSTSYITSISSATATRMTTTSPESLPLPSGSTPCSSDGCHRFSRLLRHHSSLFFFSRWGLRRRAQVSE